MTSTTVVWNRRLIAASAMEGERRRGGRGSVGSGGRDCARGDVVGRWRADVWNILGGGSGGGGFGYGGRCEGWWRELDVGLGTIYKFLRQNPGSCWEPARNLLGSCWELFPQLLPDS